MRSYLAPEQFLQSKTQSTGSVSSAIPLTYCEKGEVYEKTQSDFADLREPREDERSRRERCTVQCKQSDADARLPLRPLGTPVQPSSRAPRTRSKCQVAQFSWPNKKQQGSARAERDPARFWLRQCRKRWSSHGTAVNLTAVSSTGKPEVYSGRKEDGTVPYQLWISLSLTSELRCALPLCHRHPRFPRISPKSNKWNKRGRLPSSCIHCLKSKRS